VTRRALLLLALAGTARAEGYRMGEYRAPVPADVPGGRAIGTDEARALHAAGSAVWVDVLPAPRRPDGLPATSLWLPSPHRGIPGSLWLPGVGHGAIAPETEAWFRDMLARATGGNRDRPAVFYCLSNCWMSWNAAKRAAELGHRQVLWYPDGVDGWEAAGLPTEVLSPAPGAP
jgi:PQQ-dependent catabolism-associated CXXCW motif protein